MLRSLNELTGYTLAAEDGDIGRCKDFLFDDQKWVVRYMVADTGKWLFGRKVLISPIALGSADWASRHFPVKMTVKQIEAAPSIEEDAPVSRKYEYRWFDYHGWPYYWTGDSLWAFSQYPSELHMREPESREPPMPEAEETHVRSFKEVKGYAIHARDGDVGKVDDFIADDRSWIVRYIVVDLHKWLPGKKVIVSPKWTRQVNWAEEQVVVDADKETVRQSPFYDPSAPVNREYEIVLHDYYGRPHYWESEE